MRGIKGWVIAGLTALAAPAAHATLLYENSGDTSAYVYDLAIGPTYTNYAFNSTTLAFVGSWEVDQGPSWTTIPEAYSGVDAAALLFGGTPSDYVISTADNLTADINDLAWVSTYGGACDGTFPCGTQVADTFVQGTVPEPATWAMLTLGVAGLGWSLRRRTKMAHAA
ncbi:MAG: PEP-CTERM sorting domain-containing protein [Caulobacteraceae bacterium]